MATLIGHNDVRKAVMGRANREATPAEMKRMEDIIDKAMQDGAVGNVHRVNLHTRHLY